MAVLVTNHAAVRLGACLRDEETAGIMDVFKRGPEEGPAGFVVAGIGVAAVAAAVGPRSSSTTPQGAGESLPDAVEVTFTSVR